MKNKQKAVSNILVLILFLLSTHLSAQSSDGLIKKADSLFAAKQYTQSLDLYKEVMDKHEYSEAMLLKMAFIQEGLGQISESLYYLNLYHLVSEDELALSKMEELAKMHRLQGYSTSESWQVSLLFKKYYDMILKVLMGCAILLLALLIYLKRKRLNPMPVAITLSAFMALLFFHVNFSQNTNSGIVHYNSTYLMSGPSAGSSVIEIIGEGHLLDILDKKDVWVHTKWMNQDVYIKEDQILKVEL
ncbi:MAG: hypothetical protein WAU36_02370 [Cyclobacteriaceae bacterium]